MATESFKFLQNFGLDGSYYKKLVQAKSGNRYFVWHSYSIHAEPGQEVLITIENDYWKSINNPKNGESSSIEKISKVN